MAYTDIDFPAEYFNTLLYAGNSTGGRSITGVGFAPDFLWLKDRTTAGSAHFLSDTVRGDGKWLRTNGTFAENTDTNVITSLDSDGFTVGTDVYSNNTGDNYVAWNWLANGAGVANTSGTISSTVSANTTSGFSIVSYTGTGSNNETVGHGLGVAPSVVIIKNRSVTTNWSVLHTSAGLTGSTLDGSPEYYMLLLNDTGARANVSEDNIWQPTSTTFKINNSGAGTQVNGSGNSMIAYCFAEKKGFSKFGSYTGNGSTDGTFIYTGFKPAWVLAKRTNDSSGWVLFDNKREPFNLADTSIRVDDSGAENQSNGALDFLSNGFKWRTTDTGVNGSGNSFIFMAFAEHPFVTSTSVPTTAR
jgi:hypothetical protein